MAELVDQLDIAPDLIAFWGQDQAARKFGVLRQRFTLLRDYMSADDWNKVLKLYYEGPTAAAGFVLEIDTANRRSGGVFNNEALAEAADAERELHAGPTASGRNAILQFQHAGI